MVGGGREVKLDTFIAPAALRDHDFQLVAGAFDIIPVRGKEFGINLHVSPNVAIQIFEHNCGKLCSIRR